MCEPLCSLVLVIVFWCESLIVFCIVVVYGSTLVLNFVSGVLVGVFLISGASCLLLVTVVWLSVSIVVVTLSCLVRLLLWMYRCLVVRCLMVWTF